MPPGSRDVEVMHAPKPQKLLGPEEYLARLAALGCYDSDPASMDSPYPAHSIPGTVQPPNSGSPSPSDEILPCTDRAREDVPEPVLPAPAANGPDLSLMDRGVAPPMLSGEPPSIVEIQPDKVWPGAIAVDATSPYRAREMVIETDPRVSASPTSETEPLIGLKGVPLQPVAALSTAQESQPAVGAQDGPRTVAGVDCHWELVCWFLSRWSGLRNKGLKLEAGSVKVRCSECGTWLIVSTNSNRHMCCTSPVCAPVEQGGADILPDTLPTPLKKMLNLLRRRGGGVRSHPVIRSVPVVLQVPVLHSTGTVLKKLLLLLLAELAEARTALAKQGIYGITGRSTLGQLYLREHIKLIALIMACEDIVGVSIDSEMHAMWSLALLMTASWRHALTGPMKDRPSAVAVMELAVGLLSPLWTSFKPLGKERKAAGVASLYLHVALMHARASMGENSPAETVITDDNVERQIRVTNRNVNTRVNNVSRAQALTELYALAEDDNAAPPKKRFAAEIMMYTERITVCACCTRDLAASEAADIAEAVERAKQSGVFSADDNG